MKITDELLELAAEEAAERWLSGLPEPSAGEEHVFSREFEREMTPLIRPRKRRAVRRLVLLAAVIALLAALGSGVYAGKPEDYQVYASAQEGLLTYLARPREDLGDRRFHQLTPGWMPEGYALLRQSQGEWETEAVYRTEDGGVAALRQWCGQERTGTALGDYLTEDVEIRGCKGVFYAQTDGGGVRVLLWAEGPYVLELRSGDLEQAELMEIAEHLKW